MKTVNLLVAVVFMAGLAVSGQAAIQGVYVSITGSVTADNVKAKVANQDILGSIEGAVGIVLVYDDEFGTFNLQAVDSATNSITVLATSSSVAVLQTTGAFSVDLAFGDCFFNTPNLVINNAVLGATNNSGDLNLTGKLSPTSGTLEKISAKIIGVLNDPACTAEPARLFKGSLKQIGTAFDATALALE